MAVAGDAHLACAKGREARADASCSRNSVVVDATPEDRAAKGCDAGAAVSKQEIDASVIGGSKGPQRFKRQQVFRIRSHHPTFTGPMGDGS
jgi:hypothetical protein